MWALMVARVPFPHLLKEHDPIPTHGRPSRPTHPHPSHPRPYGYLGLLPDFPASGDASSHRLIGPPPPFRSSIPYSRSAPLLSPDTSCHSFSTSLPLTR